ncbi:hypothetical protein D0501_03775 [Leuconostoc holzapfelii]|uniref:Uncharacterized protein n=1 Tax=Leuconostoc holzapfelii TaxID=434464 RepID=A0ABT2NV23_9LACO|nr:hypothetical protein [Leuconostoc holzapfelii]
MKLKIIFLAKSVSSLSDVEQLFVKTHIVLVNFDKRGKLASNSLSVQDKIMFLKEVGPWKK